MLKQIEGGVCAPKGFRANGVHCGIRVKPHSFVISGMCLWLRSSAYRRGVSRVGVRISRTFSDAPRGDRARQTDRQSRLLCERIYFARPSADRKRDRGCRLSVRVPCGERLFRRGNKKTTSESFIADRRAAVFFLSSSESERIRISSRFSSRS